MNSTADVLRVWSTTTIITTLKVVMDPVLPATSPGWISGFENAVEKQVLNIQGFSLILTKCLAY